MNKLSKIIVSMIIINILNVNYIIGVQYLYQVKNQEEGVESSISTVANPSFTFESEAQVLMEPITGEILYDNNETEHMLPASVTKVMTY